VDCDALRDDRWNGADHLCDSSARTGGPSGHSAQAKPDVQSPYDAELCKERNIIERFFNRLKQFRASQRDTTNCSQSSWGSVATGLMRGQ
jgi:transposase